ncbi:MAG TPA: hypothetical protein VH763_14480 [Gemmatimonadales bacterium]
MKVDFSKFAGSLPYASEMYGIYQPLLGWKSALQERRIDHGLERVRRGFIGNLALKFRPQVMIESAVVDAPRYQVAAAVPTQARQPITISGLDSLVGRAVVAAVAEDGMDKPDAWRKYTRPDFLTEALANIEGQVKSELMRRFSSSQQQAHLRQAFSPEATLSSILNRESVSAGVLGYLNQLYSAQDLMTILTPPYFADGAPVAVIQQLDPAHSDIARAALSPIGTVHLFRQYFFEFDTFLGPPVQHVWLSPGGTVELVEISTRKVTIERTIEQAFESTQKSEKEVKQEDELSDAVRQENSSDTKLGVSATSTTNYTVGIVSGSVSVTGSYSLGQQQKQAREQTHKSMRQQTEKLSTEIRRSYKSTFKTVTETTDMTSKRYVLQNSTDKLINYELRRKMRQVGVQIQDYGTRLCWQAYVDNPGDTLGVALFVHTAELPEVESIKQPDQVAGPEPITKGQAVSLNLHWAMPDVSISHFVPLCPAVSIVPPAGYVYDHGEVVIQQGPGWDIHAWPVGPFDSQVDIRGNVDDDGEGPPIHVDASAGGFIVDIPTGDGGTEPSVTKVLVGVQPGPGGLRDDAEHDFTVQFTPVFKPSRALLKSVSDTNAANQAAYTEAKKQAFQEALFKSVRERVKLASNIQPRPFSELREEERIVVYRNLVQQLLVVGGITSDDPHVRHVFSEVIESMFDMDSMLYFVAPDWWMPKQRTNASAGLQGLGITDDNDQQSFGKSDVVSWGGGKANRPDNYYITEDSAPAKLGSSLGWLLQLDGDNFRNAFLNAPWVKAVIPLRPRREWKALDWLMSPTIEGSDGLDDVYQEAFPGEVAAMLAKLKAHTWPDPALTSRYSTLAAGSLTVLDAIRYLIVSIEEKQAAELEKMVDPDDPSLSYLPTDKVYEHGFDPLAGGFTAQSTTPFEVFDQWIEVLPTDQIVPVEVRYDPKTGMQI